MLPHERLAQMRAAYEAEGLTESSLAADWLTQLERWMDAATVAQIPEPNAMTLATVDPDGRPSTRTVLLKQLDDRGLVFYTNLNSHKGHALRHDPRAAVTIPWVGLSRQVCVTGDVEEVSRAQTEAYAHGRPRGSQVGAWVSHQSQVIAGRGDLAEEMARIEQRFGSGLVPVPEFWGGYRLLPLTVEFWQGQPNRLHDRLRFRRSDGRPGSARDGGWHVERLSP
jgi:pyridoxamine 5'-phosphate oxidase